MADDRTVAQVPLADIAAEIRATNKLVAALAEFAADPKPATTAKMMALHSPFYAARRKVLSHYGLEFIRYE